MKAEKRRFVGIDLGKRDWTMAVIGEKMKDYHGKTSAYGRQALLRLLKQSDKVALEAGNLSFVLAYEIQERVGCEVRVLNAGKLPFIWDAPTKTDKEDARKLAMLIEERRDEKLPIVSLPSKKEIERRKLIASYSREVKGRTRLLNLLHAMFVHQGHTTVVKKDLSTAQKRQEVVELLTGQEKDEAEWLLKHLELYEQRKKQLKERINEEARTDENMKNLQTIPGVGPVVAYAFVAHIGDGIRFTKAAAVSNYIGFVPKLYYSGTIQRQGHITKRGNAYLRGLLVQAAWSMVRCNKYSSLRERYICLTTLYGNNKKKTIVSIARRLTELMYSVLRDKTEFEERIWIGRKKYLAGVKELKKIA